MYDAYSLQRALLCVDISNRNLIKKFSWEHIIKAIKCVNKDDYLDEYGSHGFDILWTNAVHECQMIDNHLENNPEMWI